MDAPINTVVLGTPESCRATAAELGKLEDGSHDVGTGLFRVRSESESCWEGKAGDAFREAMNTRGKAGNDLGEAASRAKKALEHFAGELQTVQKKINDARNTAAEHGLTVTATTIEPPGPPPAEPRLPSGPPTLDDRPLGDFKAASDAKHAYDRKVAGYNEAKAAVEEARRQEKTAHEALTKAMNYEVGFLEYMKNGAVWTLVGINQGLLTTPQASADKFTEKAKTFNAKATNAALATYDPALTPEQQAAKAAEHDRYRTKAAWAEEQAGKSQTVADRLGRRIGVGAEEAGFLGKSVKGVPLIGTAIAAGVQADAVITDGKPIGKAAANLAGGTLGGIAGAAAVGGLVGGPVGVLVGVGVGAIASGIGSWGGEKLYDLTTEGGN
ncbi:WXG100 family type VII secretion target [Saccharopolyspora rosea]|uniref:WXG100 family type VII secretion target n=1 Tax=Saccharopolyspora rosea TaxID=524884 RepID=UPI0021D83781|nr:WXG100 family type VII secretion target [Saccharopolyspora rosea]